MEKYWKLTAEISRNTTASKKYDHEPTDDDVEKFASTLDKRINNVKVECFYAV